MASQRFAFPVPERALPRIRVTAEQHEELRAFAVRTAHDVLREGPTWGRSNVQAARERGWKVSQRSPDVCFMMKTTTTSKPVKPASSGGSSRNLYANANANANAAASSNQSISSDESPLAGATPNAQRGGGGGAGGRAFMGSVRLAGYNLDDVVSSIHCETTRAVRQQLSKSYGQAYLDCCVLQTLEGAKPYDPFWYLGLKWTALKTPFEKLVNYREFVYLEHSGTHVSASGQRMLYRIIQSVSLDDFGGERAYFGLTRAHLEAAYVYWMDAPSGGLPSPDSGVLTVCMKGLAHPKGKVPLWLVERYMKKFWKAGWSLKGSDGAAVSEMALDDPAHQITLDLATEWVADADRKACALCQKKFRFGRRMRHHCRACGEVICRGCTQYFLLTYPTSSSVGAYPFHNYSTDSSGALARKKAAFDDDDDDLPATLGGDYTNSGPRRGRMRVASENDAVMVGKVCRRCVEMKKVAIRKDTSRVSSSVKKLRASQQRGGRGTRALSWEDNLHHPGRKPQPIHEADEHDEHELPIMGHDEESDAEFFVPETPGPNGNPHHQYYHHNQQHRHQQHHHDDHDDTASEFSIGDFESSNAFKPYATLDFKGQPHNHNLHHHAIDEGKTGTSIPESQFSQSGFSVGFNAHDDDSDDDDGVVDYHSDPEHGDAVRHPQLGHVSHFTVEEEERFTSSQPRQTQTQAQAAKPFAPPPPVAQNFVLTAAALNADRYSKQDARLRLEDLLADTDDEGEQDYSTSPPMRPSALDIREMRPQPHLIRTVSAPPMTTPRMAPPPPPPAAPRSGPSHLGDAEEVEDSLAALHMGRYHVSAARDRESNLSSISFSSFDADMLIDASAFDVDDPRMSSAFDEAGEGEDDDVLYARIQKIQDEVLRRQLLASSSSSVASSLSASMGPAIRFNRPGRAPSSGFSGAATANNGTSLSEASTISSNESFGSMPTDVASITAPSREPAKKTANAQKAAQLQVESAIADQAQLLYRIQMERERATTATSATPGGVHLY